MKNSEEENPSYVCFRKSDLVHELLLPYRECAAPLRRIHATIRTFLYVSAPASPSDPINREGPSVAGQFFQRRLLAVDGGGVHVRSSQNSVFCSVQSAFLWV